MVNTLQELLSAVDNIPQPIAISKECANEILTQHTIPWEFYLNKDIGINKVRLNISLIGNGLVQLIVDNNGSSN